MVQVYVDDIIFGSTNMNLVENIKEFIVQDEHDRRTLVLLRAPDYPTKGRYSNSSTKVLEINFEEVQDGFLQANENSHLPSYSSRPICFRKQG